MVNPKLKQENTLHSQLGCVKWTDVGKSEEIGAFSLPIWITPTLKKKKSAFIWRIWSFFVKMIFLPSLFISLFKSDYQGSKSLPQLPHQSPELSLLSLSCLKLENFPPCCLSKHYHFLLYFLLILWEPINIVFSCKNVIYVCGIS